MTNLSQHCAEPHVVIIGSGFGGLSAAIALKRAGHNRITIAERAADIGGVWRDNTYPGAACDVQSYLYSFSFAPNTEWNHMFSRQAEIHQYLRRVARDHHLMSHLRLGCAVQDARWDPTTAVWRLRTTDGEIEADHMVVATGALADPVIPHIAGLQSFDGPAFHSSRWDHDIDLTGKRVAVIGTGASAIQFVPAIQPQVAELTVFQRTPPWVMPRHDRAISSVEKTALRLFPPLHALRRAAIYAEREFTLAAFRSPLLMKIAERKARKHLFAQVSDPELRAKLTPNYRLGCKRILISNEYLPALGAANTDVVTCGIREITTDAVIDSAGVRHEADVIIFGTGFKTDGLPLTDRIHDGRGTTMAQSWGESPSAYLGTMVAGFPNAYLLHGPNIGLGHTSVIMMLEAQSRYIVDAIGYTTEHGIGALEPTARAQSDFVDLVDDLTEGTVWTTGGCESWYLDATGRNSNLWPGATFDYYRRTRRFRAADHRKAPFAEVGQR